MNKNRITILGIIILIFVIGMILSSKNSTNIQATAQPANGLVNSSTSAEQAVAPAPPTTVIPDKIEENTPAPGEGTQDNAAEVDGVPAGTEVTSEPPAPAPSMPAPVPAQGQ